ncbi:antibiotic biosynthesis monooxygenase family protein [Rhodovulum euryhalinum]|uniref:Heme-degrading monooxygenase HmoA n=1 Tax=Rhodovulum euryhalinum TaxID=35805 RepID=A0A4R2KBW9_9RHOB|nr:antibiotic biosynthesis monooxygenase family protein [Rhodovulum euryhalinum]TCO69742.1 heme-degrading monooxygenase HmoA [Rhodovulum euryhalinum]
MHCLFFDVRPKPGHMVQYFAHVDRLKPVLARHRGLLYLERFRPLDAPDALLSHQLWQDEAAILAWRRDMTHRASQWAGRRIHFEAYRIRVGPQELCLPGPGTLPAEPGRWLIAAYGTAPSRIGRAFESVTRPGRFVTLTEAGDGAEATERAAAMAADGAETVRVFRIARDYTMTDRAEAPE